MLRGIHFLSAIVCFVLTVFVAFYMKDGDAVDTYLYRLEYNTSNVSASSPMSLNIKACTLFIVIVPLIASIYCVWLYEKYIESLEEDEYAPVRWIELIVTAPVTVVVLAVVAGIRDRYALMGMIGLMFAATLCEPLIQYTRKYGHRIYLQYQNTETTYTVWSPPFFPLQPRHVLIGFFCLIKQ